MAPLGCSRPRFGLDCAEAYGGDHGRRKSGSGNDDRRGVPCAKALGEEKRRQAEVGEAHNYQDSPAPRSEILAREKNCEEGRREESRCQEDEKGRAKENRKEGREEQREEGGQESGQEISEKEIQEIEALVGSALKEVPKTKTLIEKIKDDLNKRAALKASRALLKEPRKPPPKR